MARGWKNSSFIGLSGILVAFLALSMVVGCGSGQPFDIVPVSGTVKIDGGIPQPKEGFRLRFIPLAEAIDAGTHPRPGTARTKPDGTFSEATTRDYGDGLTVGKHRVEVTAVSGSLVPVKIEPAEIEVGPNSTEFDFTIYAR